MLKYLVIFNSRIFVLSYVKIILKSSPSHILRLNYSFDENYYKTNINKIRQCSRKVLIYIPKNIFSSMLAIAIIGIFKCNYSIINKTIISVDILNLVKTIFQGIIETHMSKNEVLEISFERIELYLLISQWRSFNLITFLFFRFHIFITESHNKFFEFVTEIKNMK